MTQRQEKITTIPVDDLITGWVTKDGEVEKVEIDGYSTFSSKDIAAFSLSFSLLFF